MGEANGTARDDSPSATVRVAGVDYQLSRTHCTRCGDPVLIASGGKDRSKLFDRIALDAARGVIGEAHHCPGPAPTPAKVSPPPAGPVQDRRPGASPPNRVGWRKGRRN